jgi:hypothetical protein
MPLPPKEYFPLEEVEERWGMLHRDLIYYAETVVPTANVIRVAGEGDSGDTSVE